MKNATVTMNGVAVPRFIYGTAWKEDETERLTAEALKAGFRGIDTANQRRHYYEVGVGKAVRSAVDSGLVKRDDLFIQTKYTSIGGQDQRLPYDARAAISVQVEQSFTSSLDHLGVSVIDSYILHGPVSRIGLADEDWEAWHAMEGIYESGRASLLGISNVSQEQLKLLCDGARCKPHFVQNRCYSNRGWDRGVRKFCAANGILYQGFSLLTANQQLISHPDILRIAKQYSCGPSQVIFRFALDAGMLPLTGTSSSTHMREDLTVFNFVLSEDDVANIEKLAG